MGHSCLLYGQITLGSCGYSYWHCTVRLVDLRAGVYLAPFICSTVEDSPVLQGSFGISFLAWILPVCCLAMGSSTLHGNGEPVGAGGRRK